MSFGYMELILIFLIVLIVFGAGRIPEIGAGLGKGIMNFKKAITDSGKTGNSDEAQPPQDNTGDNNKKSA